MNESGDNLLMAETFACPCIARTSPQKKFRQKYIDLFFAGLYANFADHCEPEIGDSQLPDLVDYDEYDRKVFRNPITHCTLKGYPPRGSTFRRIRSALEMQRMAKSISRDELMFQKVSPPSRGISSFEDLDLEISSSSSSLMVSNY